MIISPVTGEQSPVRPISPQQRAEHDYWLHWYRLESRRRLYSPVVPLPAEAQAKVSAYWADLFKAERAALDAQWAEPNPPVLITDLSMSEEAPDVRNEQAC